jgi:hypothetical protein
LKSASTFGTSRQDAPDFPARRACYRSRPTLILHGCCRTIVRFAALPEVPSIDPADMSRDESLVNGVVEDSFTAADLRSIPAVGLSLDTATSKGAPLGDTGFSDLVVQ